MSKTNLDTESTFYENIEGNRSICSNCYRRLIDAKLTPHHTLPDTVSDYVEYSDSIYFDYFDDHAGTGRPSVKESYCECGAVDNVKIRPFDKEEMIEVAVRVNKRLEEEDIEFDTDVFFRVVKEGKSDPDNQFNEEKLLEKAVEEASTAVNQEKVFL